MQFFISFFLVIVVVFSLSIPKHGEHHDIFLNSTDFKMLEVKVSDYFSSTDRSFLFVNVSKCPNWATRVRKKAEKIGEVYIGGGGGRDISLNGDFGYFISDNEKRLIVLNITDYSNITIIDRIVLQGNWLLRSRIWNGYLYVAGFSSGVVVFDLTDPSRPTEVEYYDTTHAYSFDFVGDGDGGMRVLDISTPSSLSQVGVFTPVLGWSSGVKVINDVAFISGGGITVVDVSSPSNIVEVPDSRLVIDSNYELVLTEDRKYLYVTNMNDNAALPGKLFVVSTENLSDVHVVNILVLGRYVHGKLSRVGNLLFVGVGVNGTKILDVSERVNPNVVEEIEPILLHESNGVVSVVARDNYLFLVDDWHGLIVYYYGDVVLEAKEKMRFWCGSFSFTVTATDSSLNRSLTEVTVWAKNQCSVQGTCVNFTECVCTSNSSLYKGELCVFDCYGKSMSDPYVCGGHGKCIDIDDCKCYTNYYGINCSISTCDGMLSNDTSEKVCRGHGACESFDQCSCDDGYRTKDFCGWNCSESRMSSVDVCSGHGLCLDQNLCFCIPSEIYYGEYCEIYSCFNISTIEISEVCSGNGICSSQDNCVCGVGYSSSSKTTPCDTYSCFGILMNNPIVCSGHGSCVSSEECKCSVFEDDNEESYTYEGEQCETWSCFFHIKESITCSGHGKCVAPNSCVCEGTYYGEKCEENYLVYITVFPLLGIGGMFLCCLLCSCLLVVSALIILCSCFSVFVFLYCSVTVFKQKRSISRYELLEGFDVLLKEQLIEEGESIGSKSAKFKIDKEMFKIDYDNVEVKSVLGRGGSNAVVYLAVWKSSEVAFKCFRTQDLLSDEHNFSDFEKELKFMSSLSHPNIVRFFGASLKPPRVGIVMGYCKNGDLLEFFSKYSEINGGRKYPISEKIRMCREIISVFCYLHSKNIIHRDLKDENVLVDGEERTKLLDFGISRMINKNSVSKHRTARVGTKVYMAPEVLKGYYGVECDVFSFAILVFVMITEDENPYKLSYGTVSHEIEFRVANDPNFRPDLKLMKDVVGKQYKWLLDIVRKCWGEDVSERCSFSELSLIFEKKKSEEEENTQNGEDEMGIISKKIVDENKNTIVNAQMDVGEREEDMVEVDPNENKENVYIQIRKERFLELQSKLKELKKENQYLKKLLEKE